MAFDPLKTIRAPATLLSLNERFFAISKVFTQTASVFSSALKEADPEKIKLAYGILHKNFEDLGAIYSEAQSLVAGADNRPDDNSKVNKMRDTLNQFRQLLSGAYECYQYRFKIKELPFFSLKVFTLWIDHLALLPISVAMNLKEFFETEYKFSQEVLDVEMIMHRYKAILTPLSAALLKIITECISLSIMCPSHMGIKDKINKLMRGLETHELLLISLTVSITLSNLIANLNKFSPDVKLNTSIEAVEKDMAMCVAMKESIQKLISLLRTPRINAKELHDKFLLFIRSDTMQGTELENLMMYNENFRRLMVQTRAKLERLATDAATGYCILPSAPAASTGGDTSVLSRLWRAGPSAPLLAAGGAGVGIPSPESGRSDASSVTVAVPSLGK